MTQFRLPAFLPLLCLACCAPQGSELSADLLAGLGGRDASTVVKLAIDDRDCSFDTRGLAEFKALETLSITTCDSEFDYGPIRELAALQSLSIEDGKLEDLLFVFGLEALESLTLDDTRVVQLAPLRSLTALQELSLRNTPVVRLEPLSGLPALEALDVTESYVLSLSALSGVSTLRVVRAGQTRIGSLAGLEALPALERVELPGNGVTDLGPLLANTSLAATARERGVFVNLDRNCLSGTPEITAQMDRLRQTGVTLSADAQSAECNRSYFGE